MPLTYLHAYETVSAASKGIGRYIDFYNTRWPHSSHAARTRDVGVLSIAAAAFGRRTLTPQGLLKILRNLFRSTGRALFIIGQTVILYRSWHGAMFEP